MAPISFARTVALLVAVLSNVALAGCTSDEDAREAATSAGVEDSPTTPASNDTVGPIVATADHSLAASVATPAYSFNGVDIGHLYREANVTGYIVELTWRPSSAAHDRLSLWVRVHGASGPTGTVADSMLDPPPLTKAEGASPLRLTLPIAGLESDAGYSVFVRAAAPVGVTLPDQTVTATLITFANATFDPAFTVPGTPP